MKHFCIAILMAALAAAAHGQQETPAVETPPPGGSLFDRMSTSELLEAAQQFREASVALAEATASLERIFIDGGAILVDLSENFALASSEFDPFGYKNAFRTIQQQQAVIAQQTLFIQQLQQQEIDRLRKELE